jgi:hypothetical protein
VITPLSTVVIAVCLAYAAYRLSLTIRSIRANRSGDTERSQKLRQRAFYMHVGVIGALLLAFVLVAIFMIVVR